MIAKSVVTSRPKVPPGVNLSWSQRNWVSYRRHSRTLQAVYQCSSIHRTVLTRFCGSRRYFQAR